MLETHVRGVETKTASMRCGVCIVILYLLQVTENGTQWQEEPLPCKTCGSGFVNIPGQCCPHCSEYVCHVQAKHLLYMFSQIPSVLHAHVRPAGYFVKRVHFQNPALTTLFQFPGSLGSGVSGVSAVCHVVRVFRAQ